MSYALDQQQIEEVSKLSPEDRLDYCLQKMVQHQELFGLHGDNGWLLLQAENDACLPVWPHPEFATNWVGDDFPDCVPKLIPLKDWVERWLPGMEQDGNLILVFPVGAEEEGIVLNSAEFSECLQEEE